MGAEPIFAEINSRLRRAVRNGTGFDLEPEHSRAILDAIDTVEARRIIARPIQDETAPFDPRTLRSAAEGRPTNIYFVQNGCGAIKVGKAVDLPRRLSQLQAGNPHPLKLIATFSGNEQHERLLHDHFWQDRIRGEWFRPSLALATLVAELSK